MKFPRMSKKRLSLIAGIALIAVAVSVAAEAATLTSGTITRFDGVDGVVEACTHRTAFGNIANMTKTFTLGPSNAGVITMFQGSFTLDDSGGPFDTGFIRLTIDGVEQSPGEVPAIAPNERGTHGFNWPSRALGSGSHTAVIQWRTDSGSGLCVDARSLIVFHA